MVMIATAELQSFGWKIGGVKFGNLQKGLSRAAENFCIKCAKALRTVQPCPIIIQTAPVILIQE